ncbi:MAG: hypothetical protein PHU53_07705 [Thermoplasmata archaeon]|nr:hypothetical protein [Thermoplasmata archaeon]
MSEHPYTAEYGSKEYKEFESHDTVLDNTIYVNPSGMEFNANFYHRSEGYTIAGSCGRWTNEIWGYRIYYKDGTTGGRMFNTYDDAFEAWQNLSKKETK